MTIKFRPNDYISLVAIAPLPTGQPGNWLALLYHRHGEPTTTWRLDYRFRYEVDAKLFEESKDRKSWYRGMIEDADEAELGEKFRHTVLTAFGGRAEIIPVKGFTDKLIEVISHHDAFKMRIQPKKEDSR